MSTQSTEKTKGVIFDHGKLDDLIEKAVRSFYKRNNQHLMYHAFGEFEDAMQVGWTRLLEAKKARALIAKDISGFEGLITVIVQRGLVDYMRTHLGRSGKGLPDYKGNGVLATTYYMDYYTNEDGGIMDLPMPSPQDVEEEVITSALAEQIRAFMAAKLNPREKMMLEMHTDRGMTMREIAKMMYVTESRVSQVVAKSKKTIRETGWRNGIQS